MQLGLRRNCIARRARNCLVGGVSRTVSCYRRLLVGGRCIRRRREGRDTMNMDRVSRASFSTGRIEKEESEVAAILFLRLADDRSVSGEATVNDLCRRR